MNVLYDAKVGDSDYFYQDYSIDYRNDEVSEFVGFADGDVEIITKTDPTLQFGGYKLVWERVFDENDEGEIDGGVGDQGVGDEGVSDDVNHYPRPANV